MNVPLLNPLSDEARFAQAIVSIFEGRGSKNDGRVLESFLIGIAQTLSLYGPDGINDDRATCAFEGQRALAIKLLAARTDAARIDTATLTTEEPKQ